MSPQNNLQTIRALISKERYPEAASQCLALLKDNPRDVEASLLYGNLAILMRRPEDAVIVFRKLLTIAPNHAIAHDKLAYLYNYLADHSNARKHAEAALRISPYLLESRLALGNALLIDGEGDKALEMFAAARKLAPDDMAVERAYIQALLQCGEFAQAQKLLREHIATHPRDIFLYTLLARSQKFNVDSADAKLFRALTDEDDKLLPHFDNSDTQVAAYMVLYKFYSDLQEIDRAFGFLARGKALCKEQRSYNHAVNTSSIERLRTFFIPEFFAQHKAANLGSNSSEPIFVTCMPRSGSTLLERVLSSHPDIVAAGELPLIGRLLQEVCSKFGKNQDDLSALEKLPPDIWQQIGAEYLRRARSRIPDSPYFIDKMPGNFLLLGFIRAALPQAKIIHLQRHPVANCLSIFETNFAAGHAYANDQTWLGQFYSLYRNSMDYWRDVLGDSIIEVNYEELVSDTGGTLQRIGQQMSLSFDTEGISSAQQSGAIQTASLWQARQPIHTQSLARWQKLETQLAPLIEALAPVWPDNSQEQPP